MTVITKSWLRKMRGYLAAAALVTVWWCVAFARTSTPSYQENLTTPSIQSASHALLSRMDRHDIHQALHGDTSLMIRLIVDWDIDAQMLLAEGRENIRRLSPEKLLQAFALSRAATSGETLEQTVDSLLDDGGQPVHCHIAGGRFLPQTYVAASILMALVQPEQIVALPHGLRSDGHLYPQETMNKIPLDTDRYNSEEIYGARPNLAFIAHYSLPATVATLRNQGLELFELNSVDTVENIQKAIIRVGHIVGKVDQATLLSLFMEAGFLAIDNRLAAHGLCNNRRVLYLNWYTHFSTPTPQSLAGQLLDRSGAIAVRPAKTNRESVSFWSLPLDQEDVIALAPDIIILASSHGSALKDDILSTSAFQSIPAVRDKRVHLLDESAQQAPCQYLLLGYYDLFQALQGGS